MKKVIIQRFICFLLCLVNLNAFCQTKKDSTVKKIPVPVQPGGRTADYGVSVPKERIMYLVLPEGSWVKIIGMLRKSKKPSDEVDEAITYIQDNAKEVPSSPTDSTGKK